MSSRFTWVALALLCLAGGALLWRSGRLEQRLIAGQRELLTMRSEANFDVSAELEASTTFARLPWMTRLRSAVKTHRAQSHYWRREYGFLIPERDAAGTAADDDPATTLLAANAAYRRLTLDGNDQTTVERLQDLGSRYADALRRDPGLVDAAYNFEFVARRREALTRSRRGRTAPPAHSAPAQTIHGHAGGEAATSDKGDFKVIIPQNQEERQQRPESGAGDTKRRKG